MSQLVKLIEMVNILSVSHIVGLNDLAHRLELSPRSVQRLKDVLVDTGFKIDVVRGPQGGYVLKSARHYLNQDISIEEMKLIQQGLRFLVQSDVMNSSPLFPSAIGKLMSSLDDYGMDTIHSYQSIRLNVDPHQYQKHIETINHSISHHLKIEMTYNKNHKEQNRYTFEPYEMVIVNNFWYVNGFDEKGRYLSLKVNRIESISITDKVFLRDDNMKENPIGNYGYRINPVKLKCIVSKADFISEYIWGKNQSIEWFDDGRFRLEVEFANENGAKDFILRHGLSLKVIEPLSLIEWLKEETQGILNQYK